MKAFCLKALLVLFVAFAANNIQAQTIRKVAGSYDSLAYGGDGGLAINAKAGNPTGVAVDAAGNMYFSDQYNNVVRKVALDGIITTVAGTGVGGFGGDGGPATAALLEYPQGIAVDALGNLYIADNGNHVIRKVTTDGIIHTVAGTPGLYGYGFSGDGGPATSAKITGGVDIAVDQYGNMYIADGSYRIRKVNTAGIISTIAGSHLGYSGDGGPATEASFSGTAGITVDPLGDIYISDQGNDRIRMVNALGIVTTIAGTGAAGSSGDGGAATSARLNYPNGIFFDPITNNLYIADQNSNKIRMVDPTGIISTVAGTGAGGSLGDGGPATGAQLSQPAHICVNAAGIFVADQNNNVVREINNTTVVSISAHPGNDICVGAADTFHATLVHGVLGARYQWHWNSADVGANLPVYANSSLGTGDSITCSISFPDSTNLIALSDTIVMTVHPLLVPHVNITNDTNDICATMPVTFTATNINGGTTPIYQWQVNGSDKTIGTSYTYHPVNGDIVTCFLTSNATCATPDTVTSNPVVMQVNADVIMHLAVTSVSGSTIGKNQIVSFVAEPTNEGLAPGYQWFINGAPVPGATSTIFSTHNLNNNDTVTCVLTGSLFCTLPLSDTSAPVVISVYNVGVKQTSIGANTILLLPNPNKGTFTVTGNVSLSAAGDLQMLVTDMLGRTVYEDNITPVQGKINKQIALNSETPSGVYMLRIKDGAETHLFQFVIDK